MPEQFRIIGEIVAVETIAKGRAIRDRRRLARRHGVASWQKKKGWAIVERESGELEMAELHWYEAHGKGRIEFKIKRLLE